MSSLSSEMRRPWPRRWVPATRGRRIGILLGIVVLALAVAAATVGFLRANAEPGVGPLPTNGGWRGILPVREHKPVMWGDAPLRNPTDQPIMVDKVTLPTRVPSVVKNVVATGSTAFQLGIARGWPPAGLPASSMEQIGGAVIQPHHSLVIIVELVPPGVGAYQVGPLIIDYHIGGTHYRNTLHEVLTVCSLPDANGKNRRACAANYPAAGRSAVVG